MLSALAFGRLACSISGLSHQTSSEVGQPMMPQQMQHMAQGAKASDFRWPSGLSTVAPHAGPYGGMPGMPGMPPACKTQPLHSLIEL